MSAVIQLDNVSILFGPARHFARALELLDAGASREELQKDSGQILGAHNCSLQVNEGEIVVLMGLSGAGKSTLLRAVNCLNPVARGAVHVHDGRRLADLTRADDATLRFFRTRRIAMVFQQFALLPWRSAAENIAFGLEIRGVPADERARRVQRQLQMVNLQGQGARRVSELSGGMQQRVGLARAFATDAPILLMDEPFSALDPLIRVRLQDELLNLQQRLRRTILFVSHDLDEALKLGSRIVIMEGGRIVQIGTPQDIITAPATEYVADFVAHMNPLKTLRAAAIMRPPPAEMPNAANGAVATDTPLVAADTPLAQILQIKRDRPGAAVFVKDDSGHVAGIIEERDIYQALLR